MKKNCDSYDILWRLPHCEESENSLIHQLGLLTAISERLGLNKAQQWLKQKTNSDLKDTTIDYVFQLNKRNIP